MNFVISSRKAMDWINKYSTKYYVFISDKQQIPYQEVTGYYIPTLLNCGARSKAASFAEYLASSQLENGSWQSYVFDTAQVIDGLSEFGEKYRRNMDSAYKWIKNSYKDGKFYDPNLGHPNIPEQFNFRVLWPLKKAGYDISFAKKFIDRQDLYRFESASHFYAYAFEATTRMGLDNTKFLNLIKKYDGKIISRPNTPGEYCFTGLSQVALSLFLCKEFDLGMKVLEFVAQFQNKSGGFYGGTKGCQYFAGEEVSWGVKFYLDAVLEAQNLWFNNHLHLFGERFEGADADSRFVFIKKCIKDTDKVLDAGCGKGRYINRLKCDRYACDIAERSKYINGQFKIGSLLRLPYENDCFDKVIIAESLEHTIFHDNAIEEGLRVLRQGGNLLIIDKDGSTKVDGLHFDEEWIDVKRLIQKYNADIEVLPNIGGGCPFFGAKITKK